MPGSIENIEKAIDDSIRALQQLKEKRSLLFIKQVAELLASQFQKGHKVLVAGNGGSLCDAAHFAEELTGFFRMKRRALPAIALSDPGHITCVGNDLGFEWIFSRGVEALGKRGDVFVALTTSGNSPNLLHALKAAKELGLFTVAFLGKDGGSARGLADFELVIEGFATSDRIQEAHMAAIHMIIEEVEGILFAPHLPLEPQAQVPLAADACIRETFSDQLIAKS
ncbi:MAG: gmhA [Chlamydiales bacterium]|jgi:D-sedoheptulose 7-phosphate isomerase|nr:gmhA [Chlamydiales bacterium]